MSIRAWGKIHLSDENLPLEEEIRLAFALVMAATHNRIGLKLGGNVDDYLRNQLGALQGAIVFELMDDPIDVNAHCLFMPDNTSVYVGSTRADTGEGLQTRLGRVSEFFCSALGHGAVQFIELNLAIEDDNFEVIYVNVERFVPMLLKCYEGESHWAPSLKVHVTR